MAIIELCASLRLYTCTYMYIYTVYTCIYIYTRMSGVFMHVWYMYSQTESMRCWQMCTFSWLCCGLRNGCSLTYFISLLTHLKTYHLILHWCTCIINFLYVYIVVGVWSMAVLTYIIIHLFYQPMMLLEEACHLCQPDSHTQGLHA